MSSIRTTRTATRARRTGRHRPHVLRRDGVVEAPSDVPTRDRYQSALAAGWRPQA
jgi:hypothetical protein